MDDRYFTPPIPNGWFQIAASDEIKPGEVKPLKYFGKDLVIWRSEDGELSVLDAFCPHLGAHLGEVMWQQGDYEAARKVWGKATESSPDNAVLQDTLKRFNP